VLAGVILCNPSRQICNYKVMAIFEAQDRSKQPANKAFSIIDRTSDQFRALIILY
jgi:hypothetical protein